MKSVLDSRDMQNCLFILSYIKKLCLAPMLLNSISLEKKRNLGLLTVEEEKTLDLKDQMEREAAGE